MSFLPPVVLEIRAQAAQFFEETARVAEATKAMAEETGAAAAGMSDKVAADAAAMGAKVATSAEEMAAKAASSSEEMARAVTLEAEQMDRGTSAAVEDMLRKVIADFDTMATKAAAAMEKQSAVVTSVMERQSATISASMDAMAATVDAAVTNIAAAETKMATSATASADKTAAAGLKVQESFLKSAATAVSATGTMSGALASAAITQSEAAAGASMNLMGIANGITKVAAVTGLVLAGVGLDMAAHFQRSTMLLVTAGGEAKDQLETVRNGILNISADTGTSAEQLAEGMYVMEKAGYRGAEGLAALRASAEGAKAENVDLATMTQAVTDVLLDYNYKMGNATDATASSVQVTNMLVAASGAAKTTMRDYANSMAAVIPIASTAKISFAEVGGAIATMTQHGQTAQQSSQNLANLIQSLVRPNNQAAAAMQQFGIDSADLAQHLGERGLSGTLKIVQDAIKKHQEGDVVWQGDMKNNKAAVEDLNTAIQHMPGNLGMMAKGLMDGTVDIKDFQKAAKDSGGTAGALGTQFLSLYKSTEGLSDNLKAGRPAAETYNAALRDVLGNMTAMRAATQLLMNQSTDLHRSIDLISKAADEGGQHISTWADTQAQLSTQLDMAKQRSEKLAIEIGTALIPAANGALSGFQDLFDGFEKGNPVLMTLAGILGGVVTISLANYTIGLIKSGIATVQKLGEMGAAALTFGADFVSGFMSAEAAESSFTGKGGNLGQVVRQNLLPALGALGAAALAAGAYIAVMDANTKLYTPNADEMKKAILDVAGASGKVNMTGLNNQFSRWNEVMGQSTVHISGLDDSINKITKTDAISAWMDHMTDGIGKNLGISGSALGQIEDHLKSVGTQLGALATDGKTEMAAKAFDKISESFVKQGKSVSDALDYMPDYKKSLEDIAGGFGVQLNSAELVEFAMGKIPKSMADAMDATQKYTDAAGNVKPITPELQKSLDDAGVSAEGLVNDLNKVLDGMLSTGLKTVSTRDATSAYAQQLRDADQVVKDLAAKQGGLSGALLQTGDDFDLTTESGSKLNAALEGVMQKGLATAKSMSGPGVQAQENVQNALNKTHDDMFKVAESMIRAAGNADVNGTAAENLTRKLLGIPDNVDTKTWIDQYASQQADLLKNKLDGMDGRVVHTYTRNEIDTFINERTQHGTDQLNMAQNGGFTGGAVNDIMAGPGFAGGGVVPGNPPSNPRFDNIQAMVNGKPLKVRSGEYIVNEPQTKRNMPWLKAINGGLNMDDLFALRDHTPDLGYASSPSLQARQAAAAPTVNNHDNSRVTTNNVSITTTADARSLAAEFSRLTSNL